MVETGDNFGTPVYRYEQGAGYAQQRYFLPWGGHTPEPPTGKIGFAGVMMSIAGALTITFGIVAVTDVRWVGWVHSHNDFLSVSNWGWILIGVGVAVLLVGVAVLLGSREARSTGVIVAGLSLIAHFLVIPLYPSWAFVVIAIDALIIWALTTNDKEASPTA